MNKKRAKVVEVFVSGCEGVTIVFDKKIPLIGTPGKGIKELWVSWEKLGDLVQKDREARMEKEAKAGRKK